MKKPPGPVARRVSFDAGEFGGDDGDRTHDPLHAMEVLSQLSYVPKYPLPPSVDGPKLYPNP